MGKMETELSSTFIAHKYEHKCAYIYCKSVQNGLAWPMLHSRQSQEDGACVCVVLRSMFVALYTSSFI